MCLITGGKKTTGFTILKEGKLKVGPSKKNFRMAHASLSTLGFFYNDVESLLPTTCPHCKEFGKIAVTSPSHIASLDDLENDIVNIVCHS